MLAPSAPATARTRDSGPVRRPRAAISMDRATAGLVVGHLRVAPEHVVFVKGIVEASEGLAALFAERGGDLRIAAPLDREVELHELLRDLADAVGGTFAFDSAKNTSSDAVSGDLPASSSDSSSTAQEK